MNKVLFLNRWNYETHSYFTCGYVDKGYNFKCSSNNFEEIVHCPHCLKPVKVADCYTSLEFHDEIGFGYCVCQDCYIEEWDRRNYYHNKKPKNKFLGEEN